MSLNNRTLSVNTDTTRKIGNILGQLTLPEQVDYLLLLFHILQNSKYLCKKKLINNIYINKIILECVSFFSYKIIPVSEFLNRLNFNLNVCKLIGNDISLELKNPLFWLLSSCLPTQ